MADENKYLPVRVTHPDVNLEVPIYLYPLDVNITVEKDIEYIPYPRTSDNYPLGYLTMALDFLEVDKTIEITGLVKGVDHKKPSIVEDDLDGELSISGRDVQYSEDNSLEILEFEEWIPMSALAIKHDSETIETSGGTTLVRDSGPTEEDNDYWIDYANGEIIVHDTTNTNADGSPDSPFSVSFTYLGASFYLAQLVQRMAESGGTGRLAIGQSDYFASGDDELGQEYIASFDNVEVSKDPNQPDETELTVEMRVAKDRV